MNLIAYYRQQFIELSDQFEPHWKEERDYQFGFRWTSTAHSTYREFFQLTQFPQEPIYLIYAILLPESFKHTNIGDAVKSLSSPYEMSIYYVRDKLLLTACISTEQLQQTSLGFLNQARGEIIDVVFSAIHK
ncbi:hypothetical protein [Paenibacillus ferrarius]|uniref:hypothetical protein n=1 Tax=Paenibacillus ferrarius TaxID=1469647 RepID=UPI003D2C3714